MKATEFAVFYDIVTNIVTRIEYRDNAENFAHVEPSRGERMIKVAIANQQNLKITLLALGIRL